MYKERSSVHRYIFRVLPLRIIAFPHIRDTTVSRRPAIGTIPTVGRISISVLLKASEGLAFILPAHSN